MTVARKHIVNPKFTRYYHAKRPSSMASCFASRHFLRSLRFLAAVSAAPFFADRITIPVSTTSTADSGSFRELPSSPNCSRLR